MQKVTYNKKSYRVYTVNTEFGHYDVILTEEEYTRGGLAIEMITVENGVPAEPFTRLTVCLLPLDTKDKAAFVDTNNNPWAKKFLKENGLAADTGKSMSSGYCTYPLYKFNTEKFYSL